MTNDLFNLCANDDFFKNILEEIKLVDEPELEMDIEFLSKKNIYEISEDSLNNIDNNEIFKNKKNKKDLEKISNSVEIFLKKNNSFEAEAKNS